MKTRDITNKLSSIEDSNSVDFYNLVKLVNEKVYSRERCDYDGATISAAKEIARKNKVRYQDILKLMRPSGALNRPVWDENGNIVPYKKIFYR